LKLEEMSWPQIQEGLKKTRTIILPVGATEEHGPHLPVFTDTIQAIEVAMEVARRRPVFVAPPIHYGVCRSTREFPGTITVGPLSLRLYVLDILLSLYDSGFKNVLVLSSHAGGQHMAALKEACMEAVQKTDLRASLVTDFDFVVEGCKIAGDGHAGHIESSRMLSIRPDLVSGLPPAFMPRRPRHLVMKSVRHLMGDGVMGDPSAATREDGELLNEMAAEGVLSALDELENFR
jgi:creatinine amidohydrolase